jgi:hypothetical protein
MTSNRTYLALALAICTIAAGLRLYRLGDWPFAGDELATFQETDSLFRRQASKSADQIDRLPRLIPVGYVINYISYELAGRTEFGSRISSAVMGVISIAVLLWLLPGALGQRAALCTGLLIALWPDHLFESQNHRFYMTAALFCTLSMALGALALRRRSSALTLAAVFAAYLAILSHTVCGMLLPCLLAIFLVAPRTGIQGPSKAQIIILIQANLSAVILLVAYIYPIVRGWNQGETWGYGVGHSLAAALVQVGWPTALLAVLGLLFLGKEDPSQAVCWTALGVSWIVATVALPFVIPFHPGYLFPFAIPAFVLAGYGMAKLYEMLLPQGRLLAATVAVAFCFLDLPSVVSYYRDGSRYDYRAAALHIEKNFRLGDRVAAVSPGLLAYYAGSCNGALSLPPAPLAELEKLETKSADARWWLVLPIGRSGKDELLRTWLARHCSEELVIQRPRLDYYDYRVEVFLYRPAAFPATMAVTRKNTSAGS